MDKDTVVRKMVMNAALMVVALFGATLSAVAPFDSGVRVTLSLILSHIGILAGMAAISWPMYAMMREELTSAYRTV